MERVAALSILGGAMTPDQLQHFSDLGLAIGAVLSFALGYMGGTMR